MTFYSQYGEDEWIAGNLTLPVSGVYVDIGCAHPEETSNTAFLRDIGWTGLAVDANAGWRQDWEKIGRASEFVQSIVSDKPWEPFNMNAGEPWVSRVQHGSPDRECDYIEVLLRIAGIDKIDFLSIDIEGKEFDVIKTVDLDLHDPTVIVSEFNTRGIGKDFRVRDYLIERGYRNLLQTEANIVYAK